MRVFLGFLVVSLFASMAVGCSSNNGDDKSAGQGGDNTSISTGGGSDAKGGDDGKGGGVDSIVKAKLGKACLNDGNCDAGSKCLTEDGMDLFQGGPAAGYCTLDCTTYAQGNGGDTDPCAASNGTCIATDVQFDEAGTPTVVGKAYCFENCKFGKNGADEPDNAKCGGRKNVACSPYHIDENDQPTLSVCLPQCNTLAEASCASGRTCVPSATAFMLFAGAVSGVCQANVTGLKGVGDRCNPGLEEAGNRQCRGFCVPLFDSEDPTTTAEQKKQGSCVEPCGFGFGTCGTNEAGQLGSGVCAFGLLLTLDANGKELQLDAHDLGQCVEGKVGGGKVTDSECIPESGVFPYTIVGDEGVGDDMTVCLPADTCEADLDCANVCETDQDCDVDAGDTCVEKKCKAKGGNWNTGTLTCRDVPSLGNKYCVDHQPELGDSKQQQ